MTRFIFSSLAALAVAAATTSAAGPAFMYNASVDPTLYNNTTLAGAPLGSYMTGGTGHMMVTVADGTLNKTVVCSVPLGASGATCSSRARWVLSGTNYWGDQPIASNAKNTVFFVNLQNHDGSNAYNTAIFSRTNGAEYQVQRTLAGENSWAVDYTAGAEHYYMSTGTNATTQTIIAVAYGNSSVPKVLFQQDLPVAPGMMVHDVNALTDSTVMYAINGTKQLYVINGLTTSAPSVIANPVANATTMHSRNLQGNSVAVFGKSIPWINGTAVPSTYFCLALSSNAPLECLVVPVDGDVIPEFTVLKVWESNSLAAFCNIKTATGSMLLSIPLTAAGPGYKTFARSFPDMYNLPVVAASAPNTVLITVGGSSVVAFNVLTQTVGTKCSRGCVGTPATRITGSVTRIVCPDYVSPSLIVAMDFETCSVAWTQQLPASVHATAQSVFAIPVSVDSYAAVATVDGRVYTLAFRSSAEPAPTPAPTPAPPPGPLSTVAPAIAFNITVTSGANNQLAGPVGFGMERGMGPLAAWSVVDSTAQQTVTCVAPLAAAGATCGKRPFVLNGTQWTVDRPIFIRDGGVFISDALQGTYDATTLLGNYTTTVVSRTNGGEMQVKRTNVGRGSVGATQFPTQGYYSTTNGTLQNFLAVALNGTAVGTTLWKDTLNDLRSGAAHDVAVSGEYVHFVQGTTIYTLNATTGSTIYSYTVDRATELSALRMDFERSDSVLVYGAMGGEGTFFAGLYVAGEGMAWMTQSGGPSPVAENFQLIWIPSNTTGQPWRGSPALAMSIPSTNRSVLTVMDVTYGTLLLNIIRSPGDVQNFPAHLGNNSFGFTYNGKWVVAPSGISGKILSTCSFGCSGAVAVRGFMETGDLRVGCALYNAASTIVAFDGASCAVAWQASLGALATQQNVFAFIDFDAPSVVAPEPFLAVADAAGVMYSFSFRATGEPAPTPRPATTPAPSSVVTPAPAPSDKKSNGGAVAGAVIGCLLAVAVGAAAYHKLKQRRRVAIDSDDFQAYQAIS